MHDVERPEPLHEVGHGRFERAGIGHVGAASLGATAHRRPPHRPTSRGRRGRARWPRCRRPPRAARNAVARPMPLSAPVTSTTRPASRRDVASVTLEPRARRGWREASPPSGSPISQRCPKGSSIRPSRQPCSSATGLTATAPAATAPATIDSGSSTINSIRAVAPPTVCGLKFPCSGDSSSTQNIESPTCELGDDLVEVVGPAEAEHLDRPERGLVEVDRGAAVPDRQLGLGDGLGTAKLGHRRIVSPRSAERAAAGRGDATFRDE